MTKTTILRTWKTIDNNATAELQSSNVKPPPETVNPKDSDSVIDEDSDSVVDEDSDKDIDKI